MPEHIVLDAAARARLRIAAARAIGDSDSNAALDCAALMPAVLDRLDATEQALLEPATLAQAGTAEALRAAYYAEILAESRRCRLALANVGAVLPHLRAISEAAPAQLGEALAPVLAALDSATRH